VGALTVEAGSLSFSTANIMGSVVQSGGVIAFSNGGALGTGLVSMTGGELLATANVTLGNKLSFSGPVTIAATHGTTLNEESTTYTIGRNTTLNIGAQGQDGTVLWGTSNTSSVLSTTILNVQAGTLKAADGQLSLLLGSKQTTVAAGAAIDVAGFNTTIADLLGNGVVTDSGAPATLALTAANFSGVISGVLSLSANGAIILTGANTYTGTTTINSGDSLQLGVGGATGSIGGGAISDLGTLSIDRNNAITLTNAISGAGSLKQLGTGVMSINTANTYSGGTTLSAGVLAFGAAGALGTGGLSITGGELLATATRPSATRSPFRELRPSPPRMGQHSTKAHRILSSVRIQP
jgi:autotransporter-associated beta strand protein